MADFEQLRQAAVGLPDVEVRPEGFQPCPVGVGVWSFVELDRIAEDELGDLVVEAWSTAVPKRGAREAEALRRPDPKEG